MTRRLILTAMSIALVSVCSAAYGDMFSYVMTLNGASENPANGSMGTGSGDHRLRQCHPYVGAAYGLQWVDGYDYGVSLSRGDRDLGSRRRRGGLGRSQCRRGDDDSLARRLSARRHLRFVHQYSGPDERRLMESLVHHRPRQHRERGGGFCRCPGVGKDLLERPHDRQAWRRNSGLPGACSGTNDFRPAHLWSAGFAGGGPAIAAAANQWLVASDERRVISEECRDKNSPLPFAGEGSGVSDCLESQAG